MIKGDLKCGQVKGIYSTSTLKLLVKETKGMSNEHCSLEFIGAEMEEYHQVQNSASTKLLMQ